MPTWRKMFGVGQRTPQTLLALAILLLIAATGGIAFKPQDHTKVIRIVTVDIPPQMDETGAGREADIIKAALRKAYGDRKIEFHVVPFTRHWQAFKQDERYDAVTTVPLNLDLDGFSSDPYIQYQNGIIYRQVDFPGGLGPSPVQALQGKRVVAFAGAGGILPEIQRHLPSFEYYAEYANQRVHSVMFARNYVDAVISDPLIFDNYYHQTLSREHLQQYKIAFDPAFCPTAYDMVFRTDEMKGAFNKGLATMKADGELDQINQKYKSQLTLKEMPRHLTKCAT